MARKPDVRKVKAQALMRVSVASERYRSACEAGINYLLLRWIAAMTAVEIFAAWERYAEARLMVALSRKSEWFIKENEVSGVKHISIGLSRVLVRGGGKYFDVRSVGELCEKADALLGKAHNPFRALPSEVSNYLDTLGAIRNHVVHGSDRALAAYKRSLSAVFGMVARPAPEEFLHAKDYRTSSPARYKPRIIGLSVMVAKAITLT